MRQHKSVKAGLHNLVAYLVQTNLTTQLLTTYSRLAYIVWLRSRATDQSWFSSEAPGLRAASNQQTDTETSKQTQRHPAEAITRNTAQSNGGLTCLQVLISMVCNCPVFPLDFRLSTHVHVFMSSLLLVAHSMSPLSKHLKLWPTLPELDLHLFTLLVC